MTDTKSTFLHELRERLERLSPEEVDRYLARETEVLKDMLRPRLHIMNEGAPIHPQPPLKPVPDLVWACSPMPYPVTNWMKVVVAAKE